MVSSSVELDCKYLRPSSCALLFLHVGSAAGAGRKYQAQLASRSPSVGGCPIRTRIGPYACVLHTILHLSPTSTLPSDVSSSLTNIRVCCLQSLPNAGDWRWQQQQGKRPRRDPQQSVISHREGLVKDAACTVIARNVAFAATETDIEHFFAQAGLVSFSWDTKG